MVLARYFIGDESIEYRFDETAEIGNAIDHLAMLYYEKTSDMPAAIYLSPDLYSVILKQNVRYYTQLQEPTAQFYSFHTSMGTVPVKLVRDNVKLFIYAGSDNGYHNALQTAKMDKHFEDIVFGVEDEIKLDDSTGDDSQSE